MTDPTEMVRLTNGHEELRAFVATTMMVFRRMFSEGLPGALILFDLRERCLDPHYEMSESNEQELRFLHLLQDDGSVHSSIRNITLAALVGEELAMRLVDPVDRGAV